jgi:hypothetical protein
MHPISYPSKQYNENHSGTYSCFISLHDSAQEECRFSAGEKNIDKTDTSVKGDTSLTDLLQKGNLNVVMW